jgi:predicted ATPase with chaperone activity
VNRGGMAEVLWLPGRIRSIRLPGHELQEFRKNVLKVMRQPQEEEQRTNSREGMSLTFPTRFMFVAAVSSCLGDTFPKANRKTF